MKNALATVGGISASDTNYGRWKLNGSDAAKSLAVYTSIDNDPSMDLALEERLLRESSDQSACLFIFNWRKPVLVLGRGQSMAGISERVCREETIPIVRRHTGGSAVLHQRSLNIALVLDARHPWSRRIDELYLQFIQRVIEALYGVGISVTAPQAPSTPQRTQTPICFEANFGETLLLNQRKVFGCAQRRIKTAVLVHGVLLLGLDIAQQSRVFNVSEDHIARTMTSIPGDTDERALIDAMIGAFSSRLELVPIQQGDHHGRE